MGATVARWLTQILLLFAIVTTLAAQDGNRVQVSTGGDFVQDGGPHGNEVHQIRFKGNVAFSDERLRAVIASEATELGFPDNVLQYYARNVLKHPFAPRALKRSFRSIAREIDDLRRYFDRELAEGDAREIEFFYAANGYHNANVQINFTRDSEAQINILLFEITENAPARLDSLVYLGLENLPPDVRRKLERQIDVRSGTIFNAAAISQQNERIFNLLKDEGYYYAELDQPIVSYKPALNTDSVTVRFRTGIRQRISAILFVDSTNGQPGVSQNMRRRQLEFELGDWYSQSAVKQSIDNILNLDTYEVVSIDTVHNKDFSDSTLPFLVFTRMRKTREASVNLLLNRNHDEEFYNIGAEGFVSHLNTFGAAQKARVYGRALLVDVSNFIGEGLSTSNAETELQLGLEWSQPHLFRLMKRRIGLGFQMDYSSRSIPIDTFSLTLNTFDTRLLFPAKLPRKLFLNSVVVELAAKSQLPIDFNDRKSSFLAENADTVLIEQLLFQYESLARAKDEGSFFTAVTFGGRVAGDKRNHPFNPSSGYLFSLAAKAGVLPFGSWYARYIISHSHFNRLSRSSVLAVRGRVGHIHWFNKQQGGVPPFDELFFAGGSTSMRAWRSREVRTEPIDPTLSEDVRDASEQTGSGTLIEASAELRLKFLTDARAQDFFTQQVARSGIALFMDIGNTNNSLLSPVEDYDNNPVSSFSAIIREPAVGAGLGFRYDLPIGPIRVDLATRVFDPVVRTRPWIWERPFQIRWQVGIGHAF